MSLDLSGSSETSSLAVVRQSACCDMSGKVQCRGADIAAVGGRVSAGSAAEEL